MSKKLLVIFPMEYNTYNHDLRFLHMYDWRNVDHCFTIFESQTLFEGWQEISASTKAPNNGCGLFGYEIMRIHLDTGEINLITKVENYGSPK